MVCPSVAEEGELTAEQLAEQIKQINVSDLLLSTVSTLGQLAYVKLSAGDRDQARLAIDALAAVLPTLEGHTDEQLLRDLKQLLANVRLAYASAVSSGSKAPLPDAASGSEPQSPEVPETDPGAEDAAPEEVGGSEPQAPEASETDAGASDSAPQGARGSEPQSPQAPGTDARASDSAREGASGSEPQSPAEPQPPEADGEG